MTEALEHIVESSNGYLSVFKSQSIKEEVLIYNTEVEAYEPRNYVESLWVNKSVSFDKDKYLSQFGGEDFISAKRNQYKAYKFNREFGEYVGKVPSIATWKRLTHPPLEYSEDSSNLNHRFMRAKNSYFNSDEFVNDLKSKFNINITYGNKPKVLLNGNFFSKLVEDINQAKESLYISNMFLKCDPGSKIVFDAIENAMRRNVKVYLILDKVFTVLNNPKCISKLKKIGAKTKLLKKGLVTAPREINPFDKRTARFYHTKSWVVDNKIAYVSGGNVIDSQVISKINEFNYRDTGVRVEGPVVIDIVNDFKSLFLKNRKDEYLENLNLIPKLEKTKRGMCFYVHNWKKENKELINLLLLDLVKKSQIHLYMNSLDSLVRTKNDSMKNKFYDEVDNALNRGVTVDLMLNGHWGAWSPYEIPGHLLKKDENLVTEILKKRYKKLDRLGILSSRDYILKRQDSGLRGHRFFQFNHNKIMLVDGSLGLISTHNLETRSFNGNIENLIGCSDENFIKDLKHILSIDMANSYPIVE